MIVTMCGEGNVLSQVGAVKGRLELFCVRVGKVIKVDVEVAGY